jgi:signal peptidase II
VPEPGDETDVAGIHPPDATATARPRDSGRSWLLFWRLAASIVVVDQISKALVRSYLSLFQSVPVIPGFVDFTHVHNTGVAFGLLNSYDLPFKSTLTATLALLALSGIVYYARHVRPEEWLARIGLSLILGGAVGNLIDRLALGYVVDFVDVYWGTWHFWAFNVADASISVGAVLVFADLLVVSRHASHSV